MLRLTLVALLLAQATSSKIKVEAAAVVVVRDVGLGENEVGPFNQNEPGTKVALLVTSADAGILSLEKKSKLASMRDDKKTDLLAAKPKKEGGFAEAGIWPFPKMGKDGKSCVIEVNSFGVPAKGSKSVLLEGTLALVTAQGQETAKPVDVKLEKGSKIKAGTLELVIEKTGKDGFDDKFPFEISISSGKGGRHLAKLRFLDGAGKEIESKAGSRSHMSGFGEESWNWDYRLKSEVKACAVEATLWKQLADVEVPFKLEVSLGL
jgi:hypothetical protein